MCLLIDGGKSSTKLVPAMIWSKRMMLEDKLYERSKLL